MVNILLWVVFGGLAGWLASELVGSDASMGMLANVIVGIVGAFVGGWIADQTGVGAGQEGADRPTDVLSFVWAVVGAVVVLLLVNLIF